MSEATIKVEVVQGSLTSGDESVLINASNTGARLGTGVSHAIRLGCGGEAYQDHIYRELERVKGGDMVPGDLFTTDAGSHENAKFVVHVAVMDYRATSSYGDAAPDDARIEKACKLLWPEIESLDGESHSVAMVALGGGTGGMAIETTVAIACQTLKAHLGSGASKLSRVRFYAFKDDEFKRTQKTVAEHFSL